jgi:hypothetical protein
MARKEFALKKTRRASVGTMEKKVKGRGETTNPETSLSFYLLSASLKMNK